mmetsp:Transcript_10012/g.22444  ORF Transcript_10012/g.22444 Transcript_10012/m.22444 type:complete len:1498 (+) Transcript_10012:129-4622(+)
MWARSCLTVATLVATTRPLQVFGMFLEHNGGEWNLTVEADRLLLEVKCPVDHWCGIGLNPARPKMDGAELITFGYHRNADLPVGVCQWLHDEEVACINGSGSHCTSSPSTGAVPDCNSSSIIPCQADSLQRDFCLNGRSFSGGPYQYPVSLAQSLGGGKRPRLTLDQSQDLFDLEYSYADGFYHARAYRKLVSDDPTDMLIVPTDAYYILLATPTRTSSRVANHGDSDEANLICASSLVSTALCLPAGLWKGQGDDLDFNQTYFEEFEVVVDVDPRYRIAYTLNYDEEYVDMLLAAKTIGWLGVGFYNQTASHPMIKTDMVVARVIDGEAWIDDQYAFAIETPRNDSELDGGSDQLLNKAGLEENGITYIFFRRSFRAEDLDPWDYQFRDDLQQIPLVYAYSDEGNDEITYHGTRRGYASIQWNTSCPDNSKYSIPLAECVPCEPGFFRSAHLPGFSATECQRCPVGTYAPLPGDERGGAACIPCGFENAQTAFPGATSIQDCSCIEGYYHACNESSRLGCPVHADDGYLEGEQSDNATGNATPPFCSPCPSAMSCAGGLEWSERGTSGLKAFHVQPRVHEGHYSRIGEYSVFRCLGVEERCPGGEPGTCEVGREGLMCSSCMGNREPGANGSCRECSSFSTGKLTAAILGGGFGLLILYGMVSSESTLTPTNSALLVAITGGQAVTSGQLLSTISFFSIDWPEPLKSVFNVMRAFTFDVASLGLGCFLSTSGLSGYVMSIVVVPMLFVAMVILHFLVRLLWCMLQSENEQRSSPMRQPIAGTISPGPVPTLTAGGAMADMPSIFGKRLTSSKKSFLQTHARLYTLVNALGTLGTILFISITTAVTAPFACIEHPNNLWTVRKYPSVVCWGAEGTNEHAVMLVIAIFASLLPLSFLAISIYMLFILPRKISTGQMSFLKASAFLTLRFAHGKHYFGLVFLARNFLISLLPTIPRAVVQIACGNFIFICYMALVACMQPWRLPQANILDVSIMGILLMVICLITTLVEGASVQDVANVIFSFILLIVGALLATLGHSILRQCRRMLYKPFRFFLCHHKLGAGAFARLLKMKLLDGGKLQGDVFIDSDNLSNLHGLFDHLRRDTHTLVLLCTSQLFYRPWCVGETVTALEHGLPIVKVLFPDAPVLNQAFLEKWEGNVPDKSVLREANIPTSLVIRVLYRVSGPSWPSITLPHDGSVSNGSLLSLTKKLIACDYSTVEAVKDEEPQELSTVIVTDPRSRESVATAYVLENLLRPHYIHSVKDTPHVLPVVSDLSPSIQVVLLVCAQGIFANADVLTAVHVMGEEFMKVLPVVADRLFEFPTTEGLLSITSLHDVCENDEDKTSWLVGLIEMIFKEIAIQMNPRSSQKELLETSQAIHTRLTGSRLRRCRDVTVCVPSKSSNNSAGSDVDQATKGRPLFGSGKKTSNSPTRERSSSDVSPTQAANNSKAAALSRQQTPQSERPGMTPTVTFALCQEATDVPVLREREVIFHGGVSALMEV